MATDDLSGESWSESLQWLMKWVTPMTHEMTRLNTNNNSHNQIKSKRSATRKSIGKTKYITMKKDNSKHVVSKKKWEKHENRSTRPLNEILKKDRKIQMDNQMSTSIRQSKNSFHQWTHTRNAGSNKAIPDRVRHVKICIRSGPDSVRLQQRPTPMRIHFKDILPCWKKLWNLRSGITGYYLSPRGVETLYSGIASHNDCFLRPQEPDVLPRCQETKSATVAMVSLPIGVWRQVCWKSVVLLILSYLIVD